MVAFKPEKTLGPVRLPCYSNHPVSLKQKAPENHLATAHWVFWLWKYVTKAFVTGILGISLKIVGLAMLEWAVGLRIHLFWAFCWKGSSQGFPQLTSWVPQSREPLCRKRTMPLDHKLVPPFENTCSFPRCARGAAAVFSTAPAAVASWKRNC